jgi:hypothetical protein
VPSSARSLFSARKFSASLSARVDSEILDAKHEFPIPQLHSKDGIENRLKQSLPSNFLGILRLPYDGGVDLDAEILSNGWVKVSCSLSS